MRRLAGTVLVALLVGATAAACSTAEGSAGVSPSTVASPAADTPTGGAAAPEGAAGSTPAVPSTVAPPVAWGDDLPPGATPDPVVRVAPTRLRIDALGVDAPVVSAGVAADGGLELPADAATVAWFRSGAVPGGSGSAVLAAHVDFDGDTGVFFSLASLEPGTRVEVGFADGTARAFVTVGAPAEHRKPDLPVDEVFRKGGPATLTLVTCGGPFDRVRRSYLDNVVVTARPVP